MKRSQSPLHGRSAAVLIISLLLAVLGFGAAQSLAATHAGHRVLIKGTAYSFDNQMPIAGATVEARGAPRGGHDERLAWPLPTGRPGRAQGDAVHPG